MPSAAALIITGIVLAVIGVVGVYLYRRYRAVSATPLAVAAPPPAPTKPRPKAVPPPVAAPVAVAVPAPAPVAVPAPAPVAVPAPAPVAVPAPAAAATQVSDWSCVAPDGKPAGKVKIWWGHTPADAAWACRDWVSTCGNAPAPGCSAVPA
jgi:hypothetical protein